MCILQVKKESEGMTVRTGALRSRGDDGLDQKSGRKKEGYQKLMNKGKKANVR